MAGAVGYQRRLGGGATGVAAGAAGGEAAALQWKISYGAGDGGQAGGAVVGVGQGREQALGVGMQRLCEERVGGGLLDDAAGVHDDDLVRDLGDDGEVVADELDCGAGLVLELLQELEDAGLDGDVEGGGGLVGDEELGAAGERHGDAGALALAAAHLVRVGAGALLGRGDADLVEQVDRVALGLAPGEAAVEHKGFGDLAADAHHGVEGGAGLLEDHGDAVAAEALPVAGGLGQQVARAETHGAADMAGRGHEAHEGERRHALAAAALADHAEGAPGVDPVAYAADDVAAAEADGEARDFEQGGGYWRVQFSTQSGVKSPWPVGS